MKVKKKAALLAAGAVVTATVAVPVLSGSNTGTTRDLPDSAQELVDSTTALYDKSEDRGLTLPEDPGIRDVRDGMYGMAPTQGRDMELKISAEGAIEAGDDLTLCHQFERVGDANNILDNSTLLAVDTATYEGVTYMAIVLTRVVEEGPFTYLGVVELGDTPKVGGMIVLSEGALTDADVAIVPTSGLVIAAYAKGDVAWARCAQIGPDATLESKSRCDWATGNPVNVNVAVDELISVVFSCVHEVDGSPVITVVQGFQQLPDPTLGISEPIDLTVERFPALRNMSFDPAQAPGNWDLAITGNWNVEGSFAVDGTAYLSCPKEGDDGHNVITLRTDREWIHPVSHTERVFEGEVNGGTSVEAGRADYPLGLVVTVNRNDQTGKAWATLRGYILEDAYGYPSGRDLTSTRAVTAQDITDVDVVYNPTLGAISMVADGVLYLTTYEVPSCDRGPTLSAGDNIARGMSVGTGDGTVWCVTESKDGLIWLSKYVPVPVVRKAYDGDTVDGTAIQGGEPGAMCKASIWRDASDDYFKPTEGGEGQA